MATEPLRYITFVEAVVEHIELMRTLGEARYGIFDRALLQSALARPQQSAAYEGASLERQAATLCFGLIKNHPFIGGNKRTATHLTDRFLKINGFEIVAAASGVVELVMAIEAGRWEIERVTEWMGQHTQPLGRR
ncbi:MAG TPA: type II toxin-antitoxin system death-on-curing family toxin [Pyrinomonadaceae bacterium]|nr:type II toxin-antitoxin system death-on-curing family toxin [Pyrinomonadaceae bacterium]